MPFYNKYLIKNMPINLTLCYLVTISTLIISILTAFITLISLFLYPFSNSFASDLSDKRTEINPFPEYDIFIVFIVQGIFSMRLISVFNSSIRSTFDILSNSPCLININLFEISVFLPFSFLPSFFSFMSFFVNFSLIRVYILLLPIYSLLIF